MLLIILLVYKILKRSYCKNNFSLLSYIFDGENLFFCLIAFPFDYCYFELISVILEVFIFLSNKIDYVHKYIHTFKYLKH